MVNNSYSFRRILECKLCVHITLGFQILTPVFLFISPFLTAKAENVSADLNEVPVTSYTLHPGETTKTIARRYGMSVEELKKLNQFRVFARDFALLGAGDALDVPVQQSTVHDHTVTSEDPDTAAQQLAGMASQTGSFLTSHPDGEATASLAKGMVAGKASQSVQEWVSQFGTAQVQLSVDEDFSLKNSSLALLHPWLDTPSDMAFSQTGIHRTDDRAQTNLGGGWRHFRGEDMFGASAFLDYDLSREHARAGFGGEYWRDNLKLAANAYVRLTGWKSSPDVEDYDERPASGWDVRAEGWLPAYPQLGGKLVYEQYYGDEVGLFGKNDRQKNPQALTAGVNYTPFPLLTLSAEQRTGAGGRHDAEFKAEINYRPGESLARQLDMDAVAASRTLQGSRYNLVDRNNNIVLEYRKQEVIRLRLPERTEGQSRQVIPLTVNVKAKHGLKEIVWDTAALEAAGGNLTGQGTQWQLTMPVWQSGRINAWLVTAVARDTRNNASEQQEMQVVLTSPSVSAADSTLATADDHLLADGQAQTQVTVTLKDTAGLPVTGMADQIVLKGVLTPDNNAVYTGTKQKSGEMAPPVLGQLKETGEGVYTTTLTAGSEAGQYVLSGSVAGMELKPVSVALTDTNADFTRSTLATDKTVLVADGRDTATLTLSLYDRTDTPVTGEAGRLTFFVADGAVDISRYTFSTVSEGQPGQYTTTFSGTLPVVQLHLGVKVNGRDTGKRVALDLTSATVVNVIGNPVVGETLTASAICGSTCGPLTYQWQAETVTGSDSYVDIAGATGVTYQPVKEDQKKKIRVVVSD